MQRTNEWKALHNHHALATHSPHPFVILHSHTLESLVSSLILGLNRFDQGQYYFRKDNSSIYVPPYLTPDELLQLCPSTLNPKQLSRVFQPPLYPYVLIAILNHHGSMAGGHYTSYVTLPLLQLLSSYSFVLSFLSVCL